MSSAAKTIEEPADVEKPSSNGKTVQLEIYRYDGGDSKPYLSIFELDTSACGPMVLDALIHLKNTVDPTLTFRRSCREGICGSCAMNLGGTNGLACLRGIEEVAVNNTLRIYPLPSMGMVRDLVVDMTPFYEQHKSVRPWLILTPEEEKSDREVLQSPENRKRIDGAYECILCACCSTSCPSYWWHGGEPEKSKMYLGPAVLLQAYRWINDSRDKATAERVASLVEHTSTMMACHNIMNCTPVCPKHLDPARAIYSLKGKAKEMVLPKPVANSLFNYF